MKFVVDSSIVLKWYLPALDSPKALKLRLDDHIGIHELLAPDIFSVECGDALVRAERRKVIGPGKAEDHLVDLLGVRVPVHSSSSLLLRAAAIALSTRTTFNAGLSLAVADREKCNLLTADPKVIGNAGKHSPFVTAFPLLP